MIYNIFTKIKTKFQHYGHLIVNFLFLSTKDNAKLKLRRYSFYFVVVIILNILVGKNITHVSYPWYSNVSMFLLLNINIILVIVLMMMVFRNLIKVLSSQKRSLKVKLVIFSILVTVIPVVVLFAYSSQLLNDNINKWFSKQTSEIVNTSKVLVNDFRVDEQKSLIAQANFLENLIYNSDIYKDAKKFEEMFCFPLKNKLLEDIVVFDQYGKVKLRCAYNQNDTYIDKLLADSYEYLKTGKSMYGFDERARGIHWAAIPRMEKNQLTGGILAVKYTSDVLFKHIEKIDDKFKTYHQNIFFAHPIKNSAILQLLQLSLLVLFASIWGSMLFARTITKPIEELSKASDRLSKGFHNVYVKEQAGGEIGNLINTFNSMANQIQLHTQELNSANTILSEMYDQIYRDNMYIDTIFKKVDSAIILLSNNGHILKSNIKADIFISDFKKDFDDIICKYIEDFQLSNEIEAIQNIEIPRRDGTKIYFLSLSRIKFSEEEQILVVLGDVTDIIDSQKIALWKDVAAKIAHEVKNPLTPIKLMAERVKRRSSKLSDIESKSIISESMDIIITEADNLKELIEEFNMFARLPKADKHQLNLFELLSDTIYLYKETYTQILFNIDCNKDILINCDKLQLRRVFQNLISNAIHVVDISNGIIDIIVRELDRDSIEIKVQDNGKGIEDKDISELFKPYFSKRQGGTGLGLAIVKKIIEEHNGKITANNRKEQGAVFTIVIPRGM